MKIYKNPSFCGGNWRKLPLSNNNVRHGGKIWSYTYTSTRPIHQNHIGCVWEIRAISFKSHKHLCWVSGCVFGVVPMWSRNFLRCSYTLRPVSSFLLLRTHEKKLPGPKEKLLKQHIRSSPSPSNNPFHKGISDLRNPNHPPKPVAACSTKWEFAPK